MRKAVNANKKSLGGAKPALQARSKRTRDAILKAVADALEGGALEKASVQDLARAAGVSIGAFYGRFDSKDTAIAALFDERRTRLAKKLTALCERAGAIEEWAQQAVAIAMDHAKTNRSLIAWAARSEPAVARMKENARADSLALADAFRKTLQRTVPELSEDDAASAAGFCIALVGGMTRDAAVFSASLLGAKPMRAWFEQSLADSIVSFIHSKTRSSASKPRS